MCSPQTDQTLTCSCYNEYVIKTRTSSCFISLVWRTHSLFLCRAISLVLWTLEISLDKHNSCVLPRLIKHLPILVIIKWVFKMCAHDIFPIFPIIHPHPKKFPVLQKFSIFKSCTLICKKIIKDFSLKISGILPNGSYLDLAFTKI